MMVTVFFVRVLSSRCKSQRSLAKVSPKLVVGIFESLRAGLSSSIIGFVACLGPATQKQKFLVMLRLMEYRKWHL